MYSCGPYLALFYPEDGNSIFLRKVSNHLLEYPVLYLRRSQYDFRAVKTSDLEDKLYLTPLNNWRCI
jgi:hypothetical protein